VNINLTMFAQALLFVLFIIGAMKLAWPIMQRKIDARQQFIADGLAQAERGRSSLAEAEKQTDTMLKEARDRAHEIVAAAEKTASLRIEESKSSAKTEGDRLLAAAKAQIEQEVHAAKQALRDQVASLAVTGAEKILRREVDAKAHADMLNQLKGQL
jgi:F-type H+-transporting ATPase subunit b